MDVNVALTILSETNAALFERFFPGDPQKFALADLVRTTAHAFKVMQSRKIEDKKDRLRCALRFYLDEQIQVLDKFVDMITKIKWYSKEGPSPGKGRGPKFWSNYFYFPQGAKLAVSSVKQLHTDLEVYI